MMLQKVKLKSVTNYTRYFYRSKNFADNGLANFGKCLESI